MFCNYLNNQYTVEISSSTPNEVIEWFEIMNNCNILSETLIDLVHREIKMSKNQHSPEVKYETVNNRSQNTTLETNFISSLYNWQDSTTAIFNENNHIKKEKKKMLSI